MRAPRVPHAGCGAVRTETASDTLGAYFLRGSCPLPRTERRASRRALREPRTFFPPPRQTGLDMRISEGSMRALCDHHVTSATISMTRTWCGWSHSRISPPGSLAGPGGFSMRRVLIGCAPERVCSRAIAQGRVGRSRRRKATWTIAVPRERTAGSRGVRDRKVLPGAGAIVCPKPKSLLQKEACVNTSRRRERSEAERTDATTKQVGAAESATAAADGNQ